MKTTRFLLYLMLSIFLFSACTRDDENYLSPDLKIGASLKEANIARLYAIKKKTTPTQQAIAVTSKLWPAESTIKIKFLNGNSAIRDKVVQLASEWEQYINLTFEYVADTDNTADVKIGFDWGDEEDLPYISWVTIGTDCQSIPQDEASINFVGFYDPDDDEWVEDDEFIKSEVLRAYGAMLGLGFEHRSPVSPVEFYPPTTNARKQKLWGYFGMTFTIEEIQDYFIDLYSDEQTNYTDYDPTSIMVLPLPTTILKDPKHAVAGNNKLSETDKRFISTIYPKNLKIEWVTDAFANGPTCMDVYNNFYFFTLREFITRPSGATGYHLTLKKLNTNTGAITTLFDVPDEYDQIREVGVDSRGNVYMVSNIDLLQGKDLLMFDNRGNLIRNLNRWTGAMHFSLYARSYQSIRVLDNDELLYTAGVSETNCGTILEIRHYKYNLSTNTSELLHSFSANDYWMMRGNSVADNDISYLRLDYLSGQAGTYQFMKYDAAANSYSFFNISYPSDDLSNVLAYDFEAEVISAGRQFNDLNFVKSGDREKWPGCYETIQFFYTMNAGTKESKNLGLLPSSIIKPDNTVLTGLYYQPSYGHLTGNGMAYYGIADPGYLVKITNIR